MKKHSFHIGLLASGRHALRTVLLLIALFIVSSPACAAKVLIIGTMQYPFVAEVANDIRSSLKTQSSEYGVAEVKGKLNSVVEREGALVVVALGNDAVAEALRLPPDIAVVYGLVVTPPKSSRPNTTGVYLSPPASEYVAIIRRYLPAVGKVSVVGSPAMIRSLAAGEQSHLSAHQVNSSVELLTTLNRLADSQALLLLPDVNLLTASVMENVLAYSFRKNVPLLGISEGNVKQGALLALVFDAKSISWQIGERVQSILNGDDAGGLSPSPPRKYNLFINTNTARKMGISVPAELLKRAKKIYP